MIIYAIRQRLSASRAEMRIRNLSGVLDKDIMRPYLNASIQEGLMAGIAAAAILILNILLINGNLLRGVEISFLQTLVTCICVILISLALYIITTTLTSRRFLQSI